MTSVRVEIVLITGGNGILQDVVRVLCSGNRKIKGWNRILRLN